MIKYILLSVVCLCAVGYLADAATYTTKYDNIDLEEILNNDRIYVKYFDCLKGTGKCTPDGKELKDVLPDALQTACEKCSEKQKKGTDRVLSFLLEKKPQDYLVLEKIYDPERVYRNKYKGEVEKKGLKFPDK
ncbi:hypothetical protein O3M35_009037 [Rhynocoris fuscipes]|uniref:Chemosensory protein n=1 Tax=Rhynocoris fuscipes TaxID=488301 RepID=A0AAW1D1K0_9HEMI